MSIFTHTIPLTAIIENNGQLLFIKRSRHSKNMAGKWVFPGGKVEHGEDAIQALYRELDEETGLDFTNDIAFLSSYKFPRAEDNSSSIGFVFLVRSRKRNIRQIDSIEEYRWINPEDIADYDFSHKPIVNFDVQTMVTIPGMEVHVRNALIAIIDNKFLDKRLLSVSTYQDNNCSMSKEYLIALKNSDNTSSFINKYGCLPHGEVFYE